MSHEAEQDRLVDTNVLFHRAMAELDGTIETIESIIGTLYEGDGLRNSLYELMGKVRESRAKLWGTREFFGVDDH